MQTDISILTHGTLLEQNKIDGDFEYLLMKRFPLYRSFNEFYKPMLQSYFLSFPKEALVNR